MPADSNRCPKCGFTKASGDKATITQWMKGCRCDLQPAVEGEVATRICKTCGKRISQGRAGSLTQWIFGSNVCSCENQGMAPAAVAPVLDYGRKVLEDDKNEIREEVELELDPDTFPKERYKPLSELGRGASGIVYLCRDRLLGKKVAVKCLRSVTAAQLLDFQNEARATSQLSHPGVVTVMDFGSTAGGAPFMVMEFVQGVSLDRFIQDNGPIPPAICSRIFADIGRALAYAHDKGIFHRDLKSSNIVLFDAGEDLPAARLIDFGVAGVKHANQEPTIVRGVTLVGTPLYMPPDQAFGLPYTAPSEVYALGCVLFEALTGQPPFLGGTALETIGMHAHEPPPTLSEARPDLFFSEDLETILERCLEKHPHDRYRSMKELSLALTEAGMPPSARKEPSAVTAGSGRLKVAPVLAVTAIIALLTIALATFAIVRLDSSNELTSTEYSDKAWVRLQEHHFDEAITCADKALEKDPDNVGALEVRALANLAKKKPSKSLPDISLAIKKYETIDPVTTKSLAFLRSGGPSLYFHRVMILKALGRKTDDKTSYLFEPHDWEKELYGDFMPTQREMRFADVPPDVQEKTDESKLFTNLALKAIESKDQTGALRAAKSAVVASPDNESAHDVLGVAYMLNGDPEEALKEFNWIIARSNSNGAAFFHRGVVKLRLKQNPADVIDDFMSAKEVLYTPTRWEIAHYKDAMGPWNQLRTRFPRVLKEDTDGMLNITAD